MSVRIVKNNQELKKAIEDKVDTIRIAKEFEKEMMPIIKLMQLPAKKIAATVTFLSVSGAAIVASLATAPVTLGMSSIVSHFIAIPSVGAFAATSGISIPLIIVLILLCVVIGVGAVIDLLKVYEIVEEENDIGFGPDGFCFKRKRKYKA